MQIGERAALMFTAICCDLDRVFQRVELFQVLWIICSGQRADTDTAVAKCGALNLAQLRWLPGRRLNV
jgi:hypothetical protein